MRFSMFNRWIPFVFVLFLFMGGTAVLNAAPQSSAQETAVQFEYLKQVDAAWPTPQISDQALIPPPASIPPVDIPINISNSTASSSQPCTTIDTNDNLAFVWKEDNHIFFNTLV